MSPKTWRSAKATDHSGRHMEPVYLTIPILGDIDQIKHHLKSLDLTPSRFRYTVLGDFSPQAYRKPVRLKKVGEVGYKDRRTVTGTPVFYDVCIQLGNWSHL
jgi:hypothetical protein